MDDGDDQPCTECGFEDPISLHHFPDRHHGTYAKLCTSCVLTNNLTKYCIICFNLLLVDETAAATSDHQQQQQHVPDPNPHAICQRCPAVVHLACLPASTSSSGTAGYVCPRCSDRSSFKFFDIKSCPDALTMDLDLFKQLACAGKIAIAALRRAQGEVKAKEEELAREESTAAIERVVETVGKYLKLFIEQEAREGRDNNLENGDRNVAAGDAADQGLDDNDDDNADDHEQEQQQAAADVDDNDDGDDDASSTA